MKKKSLWLDVSEDGDPVVDWEQAVQNAMNFDSGDRDLNSSLGKILTSVQRSAFEKGYEAGINTTHPQAHLLSITMGNA